MPQDMPVRQSGSRRRHAARWSALRDSLMAGWTHARLPGPSFRGMLPPADEALRAAADQLRHHVAVLAEEIGPRCVTETPRQLSDAADHLAASWSAMGGSVRRQEYGVDGVTCCNLEIEIPGTTRPDEVVVVGAHYDSVPGSPAANDNGSGVAAMLELSRRFLAEPSERTLRFVAFVNEELPYAHTDQMGSRVYARRCRERGDRITAMLSLETIGCYKDSPGSQRYPAPLRWLYPSQGNFIAFVGNTRYRRLVRQVLGAFRAHEPFPSQGGALPEFLSDIGRSDHWSFWQEGYPALMVTDTAPFRYAHYHTPADTVDKIDFDRTARVVRGLVDVIRTLGRAR